MPTHSNPTKLGNSQYSYTFNGWSPEISSVVGDATYKATYTEKLNKYTYKFYDSNGTIIKQATINYNENIVAPTNPVKSSTTEYVYAFDGWYTEANGGTKVTSFGKISTNVNYYARYTQSKAKYTIYLYYESGGSLFKAITQEWGTTITMPSNPSLYGYTFAGWSQTIPTTMPKNNLTIYGTWKEASYSLTVKNNAGSKVSYTGITSGNYAPGSSVSLSISSKAPTYQISWNVNGTIYTGDSVKFYMPSQATIVTITSTPYTKISSTQIQMGTYPQSKVTDSATLDAITSSSKCHITSYNQSFDRNYWYNIGEITLLGESYDLWYIDIDLDDDGYNDYRGIFFPTYRPYDLNKAVGSDNSWQDNGGFVTGRYYWFKYEPIVWNISLNDSGKQYLYADKILDGQYFYPSTDKSQFLHNGGTAYATTYRYSNLYAYMVNSMIYYLNSDQISLLTGVQSSGTTVKMTVVEESTLWSPYVMTSNSARQAKVTDYAKCIGVYANSSGYGDYWTSTATGAGTGTVVIVDESGASSSDYPYRICGIRPFIAFDTTKVTL